MRYLLMCYMNPAKFGQMSQEAIGAHLGSYLTYNNEAQAAGVLQGAEQGSMQAYPFVASPDGIHDGTVEPMQHQFGGMYILNVADRAAAETWAAKIPTVRDGVGSIQVFALNDAPTA